MASFAPICWNLLFIDTRFHPVLPAVFVIFSFLGSLCLELQIAHLPCACIAMTAVTDSPICMGSSPHDVLFVVKQRIPHPAHVLALELHIERVHHEFALAHVG